MNHVWSWPTMGSYASLSIPTAEGPASGKVDDAVREVRTWLVEVEDVLSPYRAGSDLCRWRGGRVELEQCSPLLAEVIEACGHLQAFTRGGFHPYDRVGRFDPTGYVKGWAVERAVAILEGAGVPDACLGVGGDLQLIGRAGTGRPWRVAVVDPADGRSPLAIVEAPDTGRFAVATSGDTQRGNHIWALPAARSGSGASAARLRSITVVGPDLRLADAFATAIWSHERSRPLDEAWSWLAGTGYEAVGVDLAGEIRTTAGMAAFLVRPTAPRSAEVDSARRAVWAQPRS